MDHALDPELASHDTWFIYPFLQDVLRSTASIDEQREVIRRLPGVWRPWWRRLALEPSTGPDEPGKIAQAIDDSYFFLPYIRNILYPEAHWQKKASTGSSHGNPVESIERAYTGHLADYAKEMQAPVECLHLTLDNPAFALPAAFVVDDKKSVPVPAVAEWIDVLLFTAGIGLIVVKCSLSEPRPTVGRLMTLNRLVRTVHPPTVSSRVASLHFTQLGHSWTTRDWMDYLAQGLSQPSSKTERSPSAYLQQCQTARSPVSPRYSESEPGQVLGERCILVSFACLAREALESLSPGAYSSGDRRLLAEMAYCRGLDDTVDRPEWQPAPDFVKEVESKQTLSIWKAWNAMATPDALVFLGEDVPFTRYVLRANIANDYLALYLYVAFLKYQLYAFSGEMMGVVGRPSFLRKIKDRFLHFRNRYWFTEISRRWQGNRLFHLLIHSASVSDIYQLVSSEIDDIQGHLEADQSRRINNAINALTFVLTPLATAIAICSAPPINSFLEEQSKGTAWWVSWYVLFVVAMASLCVGFAAWLFNKRGSG